MIPWGYIMAVALFLAAVYLSKLIGWAYYTNIGG